MKDIDTLIETIEKTGKYDLATVMRKYAGIPVRNYVSEAVPIRAVTLDPVFIEALELELALLGYNEKDQKRISTSLATRGILQTAPHLGVRMKPRMLCIDWMSTLGQQDEPYIVGMFAANSFSNTYRPGRLYRNDTEYNLFPKTHQDDLVFRSIIQEKAIEQYRTLPEVLHRYIEEPEVGSDFCRWALGIRKRAIEKVLGREIVYFNIHEVLNRYVVSVLDDDSHPITRLFLDTAFRSAVMHRVGWDAGILVTAKEKGKYLVYEPLVFKGDILAGSDVTISLDRNTLKKALGSGRVTLLKFPAFLILAFVQGLTCLGSFMQVEYLSEFKRIWQELGLLDSQLVQKVSTHNLTTGMFPGELKEVEVLDILEGRVSFDPNPDSHMSELWLAMADVLVS